MSRSILGKYAIDTWYIRDRYAVYTQYTSGSKGVHTGNVISQNATIQRKGKQANKQSKENKQTKKMWGIFHHSNNWTQPYWESILLLILFCLRAEAQRHNLVFKEKQLQNQSATQNEMK